MNEKGGTHLRSFTRKARVKRALALMLCASMLLSILPAHALAALEEGAIITGVTAPDPSGYAVDIGTELTSVGLPAELEITVATEEIESTVC